MAEPKWVIAGFVRSGGIFDIIVLQGLKVIPVDVYVPGCLQTRANSMSDEIARTSKNRISKKKKFSRISELLALIISNKMALENTAIQDKLVATFVKQFIIFNKKRYFFFEIKRRQKTYPFLKNDPELRFHF
jgi:hypothetical protein